MNAPPLPLEDLHRRRPARGTCPDGADEPAGRVATLDPPTVPPRETGTPPSRFCVCGHELHVGPCLARLPDRCSCLGGREAAASVREFGGSVGLWATVASAVRGVG